MTKCLFSQILVGTSCTYQHQTVGCFQTLFVLFYFLMRLLSLSINIVQYICGMQPVFVKYCWYHQTSPGIISAQKSFLMNQLLTMISLYFTVQVSDHQYWVSDCIRSESICQKFSRCQALNPQVQPYEHSCTA